MKSFLQKFGAYLTAAIIAAAAFATPTFAANSTVVVTPSNTQGWITQDTNQGGAVHYVTDSASPYPSGVLQLTIDNTSSAKAQYVHAAPTNTLLSSVSQLSYWTKQVSASFAQGDPSFQIPVFLNGGTSGFTTLVYEPYYNGTVTPGVWQQWNVDQGLFWSSRTVTCSSSNDTVNGASGGPATYTLTQIESMCPDAVVIGFSVNVGSGNPSYNVYVDGVDFNGTTYNFQTQNTPLTKNECKDNGYKNYTDENGKAFKNQGQCVSFAAKNSSDSYASFTWNAYSTVTRVVNYSLKAGDNMSGTGTFHYSDASGGSYDVNIQKVNIVGNTVYFAGPVSNASDPSWNSYWLFAKAQDNGTTGDLYWGSFTDQTTAINGVTNASDPGDGPFSLIDGFLVVSNQ